MYVAKQASGQTWRYGSQDLVSEATERLHLENELRHALSAGELRLFYQPKMELDSRRIYALEALIRWQHPRRGLISPALFLPVDQESHLIIDIGEWVLDEALRQRRVWQDAGQPKILLDVNVDGAQLARGDFIEVVERAFARSGAKPGWLGLEITETAIMTHGNGVLTSLQELHRLGIELSIDDFGTGHSSLTRLKSMPKCTLKIDASFVRKLVEDAGDRAIIASTVALAHQLGLKTVAEGVEDEHQLRLLREMGCDAIQGYFLARPMSTDEVLDFLREQAAKGRTPI
jgi:EAL domain-containing protein (putative c-di-GMP-specific phosphodiesterase class I)